LSQDALTVLKRLKMVKIPPDVTVTVTVDRRQCNVGSGTG
jgi:hypothetical protein